MTKTIQLTQGFETVVDSSMYDQLMSFGDWFYMKGYASRNNYVNGKNLGAIYMHRIVLPPPAGMIIDHIDRDTLNNTLANLRIADKSLNAFNSKIRTDNTTGYRGISYDNERSRWKVQIKIGSYRIFKRFHTIEEAVVFHQENYPLE